jgi:ParB-like chromosome segregation protein Spo0J
MQVQQYKVEDLIPYANNSRTHSDAQVAQIAASIKEFGWTNPILVDGEKGIIAGHGRLLAARKLGMGKVPVIELTHLSEAQKKALVIADNKLALNSDWDEELLKIEFQELLEGGFNINLTGFDETTVEDYLNEEDVDLGLLPEEKLDNFLNGDTKILRLAYDDQEFNDVVDRLKRLQERYDGADFSAIVLDLVLKECRK